MVARLKKVIFRSLDELRELEKLCTYVFYYCAGAGIYFAINIEDAKRKANAKGVLITCSVKLGNVKTISESGDSNVTFTGLVNEGFDSVLVPRKAGVEHVVYNCSQVDILKMEDLSNNKVLYTKSASDDNLNPSRHRSQSAHYYRSRHQACKSLMLGITMIF